METDRLEIVCAHCHAVNRVPTSRLADDPVCGRCGAPVLSGAPVVLSDADFAVVTARTELPVVVDFWAAWCGPCMSMAPHFEQAARQLKGRAVFAKVDSDANPQTAARFAIRSLPTLVRLVEGREADRKVGALRAPQIVAWAG